MSTPSGQPPTARPPLDSTDQAVPVEQPNGSAPREEPAKKTPWAWIAAVAVLVVVAGGFAIWAFGLNSDLSDQKDATTQAQQESTQAKQEAEKANEDVSALQAQIDSITQAVSDATNQLQQSGDNARQNAESALAGLNDKLAAMKSKLADVIAGLKNEADASATPA